MLAFKLAIFDQCQCILLCVRILLAKHPPFSTTSETLSYHISIARQGWTDCTTEQLRGRLEDWSRGFNHLESSRLMWLATGERALKICTHLCKAVQRQEWLISADQLVGRSQSTFWAPLLVSIGG